MIVCNIRNQHSICLGYLRSIRQLYAIERHKKMNLFSSLYHIPISSTVAVLVLASAECTTLFARHAARAWWKPLMALMSLAAIGGILYITIFMRETGRVRVLHLVPFHSYVLWLCGEQADVLRSGIMNIFLFVPLGIFVFLTLPRGWSWRRKILLATSLGCVISIGVECAQFFLQCGETETDDVIHNTLGALLGSGCIPLEMRCGAWLKQHYG